MIETVKQHVSERRTVQNSCENKVSQHEDSYIHIPKSWAFPLLLLCGLGVFVFVSLQIFSLDSSMMKNAIEEVINNKNFDVTSKLIVVAFVGIIIEAIISVLTNRIRKLLFGLLEGLLWGLLAGLFVGLFVGLLWGLLVGLFVGLLASLWGGLFVGLFVGLLDGEYDSS